MTNKEHKFEPVSISAEEVWKSLEEQDKTGVYKQAREMAGIAREQLEYAYNSGYETAKAKYERPQGEWVGNAFDEHYCNRCGHPALWEEEPDDYYEVQSNFCPNCGARMQKGGTE